MDIDFLLTIWTERLRQAEPQALAILCHGSYARATPEVHSDLDLMVLLNGEAPVGYRSIIEEQTDGRLLHVTIATLSLEDWLSEGAASAPSEAWAFYLPVRQVVRLLWATPQIRARLENQSTRNVEAAPQLQDLLESLAKVRNAAVRTDELGVRLAAQEVCGFTNHADENAAVNLQARFQAQELQGCRSKEAVKAVLDAWHRAFLNGCP